MCFYFCLYFLCFYEYTGWPRKNAPTLIVKFKNIINKNGTDFCFIMWKIHFPTKWHLDHQFWVRCLDPRAILVRQCHFQNLVLFRPHRTLEHSNIPKTLWTNGAIHDATVDYSGMPWSEKFLLFQGSLGSIK